VVQLLVFLLEDGIFLLFAHGSRLCFRETRPQGMAFFLLTVRRTRQRLIFRLKEEEAAAAIDLIGTKYAIKQTVDDTVLHTTKSKKRGKQCKREAAPVQPSICVSCFASPSSSTDSPAFPTKGVRTKVVVVRRQQHE
jgi:hypothetical protein